MMTIIKRCNKCTLVVFLFTLSIGAFAQEESTDEGPLKRNKITVELSHTHVPAAIDKNGKKAWQSLPSWGLNYDFIIDRKWAIGLHTDMVIQDFAYEENEGIIKERSRPVASALVGTRSLGEHVSLVAGGGIEVAPEGTLGLVRVGLDGGWELPKKWEITISLMADFKIDAYDVWVLGIGVGKLF